MQRSGPYGFGGSGGGGFGLGSGAPAPRDLLGILVALFATFSLQFFNSTEIIPVLLRLSPAVFRGFVWQIVAYPFVGWGKNGFWFLLQLLILFWFGRDVFWRLGRRRFWLLLARAAIGAAIVALVVELARLWAGGPPLGIDAFSLMQGQLVLLAITIAAFATLWGEATILLFFVLPVKARWFLWLEILFAFVFGLLPYKDVAGFFGVVASVFLTYSLLSSGGPGAVLHRWRKEAERKIIEQRLGRMRRKRNFGVIDGDRDRDDDEYIH